MYIGPGIKDEDDLASLFLTKRGEVIETFTEVGTGVLEEAVEEKV